MVATLGTGQDEQVIDALEGDYREHFMLHYNFPPYSVGEASFMRSPGRREIGHGKLAWRAVRPLLPPRDSFPYTIRVVSEITESNGSSSMATVCGTSLALMDAGVPIGAAGRRHRHGPDQGGASGFAVLSDILGDEDHLGDMDFKVAGTEQGVTSLQMDIKIAGITEAIMRTALTQARDGRLHILGEMAKGISGAREEMRDTAPRISVIHIPQDKIGTGDRPGRQDDPRDLRDHRHQDRHRGRRHGQDRVRDATASQQAVDWIRGLTSEPEVGVIYTGKVVRVVDFGAFINFLGSQDGLCHISELKNERVAKVTDVVKEGDVVKVKVLSIDDRGKVKLSMRAVDQETGEELEVAPRPPRPAGEGQDDRGHRERGPRRHRRAG